jgi:hypothetical protein
MIRFPVYNLTLPAKNIYFYNRVFSPLIRVYLRVYVSAKKYNFILVTVTKLRYGKNLFKGQ